MENSKTSSLYNYISCLLAFLIWGGWAYFINAQASIKQRLLSGSAQGVTSALVTLIVIKVVTTLFNKFDKKFYKYYLPTIIVNLTTISLTSTIHYFIGTPNILFTVLPGFAVGIVFSALTTYKLIKVNL